MSNLQHNRFRKDYAKFSFKYLTNLTILEYCWFVFVLFVLFIFFLLFVNKFYLFIKIEIGQQKNLFDFVAVVVRFDDLFG